MTTFGLLLSAAKPSLSRLWSHAIAYTLLFFAAVKDFCGEYEASIIEPDEWARIIAEHKQAHALYLAGKIEEMHEEMGR